MAGTASGAAAADMQSWGYTKQLPPEGHLCTIPCALLPKDVIGHGLQPGEIFPQQSHGIGSVPCTGKDLPALLKHRIPHKELYVLIPPVVGAAHHMEPHQTVGDPLLLPFQTCGQRKCQRQQ